MNEARTASTSTPELHRLIHQAWQELEQARHGADLTGVGSAERRMNNLLDILGNRMATSGSAHTAA